MNVFSGRIDCYDDHSGADGYLQVIYSSTEIKGRPDVWTFKTCPHCDKLHFAATDFKRKGNEPFFNLISEQFYVQPPVPKFGDLPNEGRKVLLFSDSRQRAAVLARDFTKAADKDAMKKALTIAAMELQQWAREQDEAPKLNLLYTVFLKVAHENNLLFFYGNSEDELKKDLIKMASEYDRKNGKVNYGRVAKRKFKTIPHEYTFIQHCRAHAATLSEFERYAMISNFTPFEGGIVLIHRLSSEYSGCNKNETKKKSIIFWTATLTRCSAAP